MLIAVALALAAATPPVEHRLTPDAAAAAVADGAERNRAADALALSRGDPGLALPGETDRKIHGEVGVGIGTGGARDAYGIATAPIGDSATATFGYGYSTFDRRPRTR